MRHHAYTLFERRSWKIMTDLTLPDEMMLDQLMQLVKHTTNARRLRRQYGRRKGY